GSGSGTTTKTLGGATIVNGNVTISSNAVLDASASNFAMNVKGNWANSGAFTQRSATVTFDGGAAQAISGSTTTTFNNLTLNNAAGLAMSTSATVAGATTLTTGTLGVGTTTLT